MDSFDNERGLPSPTTPTKPDLNFSTTSDEPSQSAASRSKISRACDACRHKRKRCDGLLPICSPCHLSNNECSYTNTDGRLKGVRTNQVRRLQAAKNEMQTTFDSLMLGSADDAFLALQNLRKQRPQANSPQKDMTTTTQAHGRSSSLSQTPDQIATSPTDPLDHPTFKSNNSLDAAVPVVFGPANLPPADVIKKGANCFHDVAVGLFYIMSLEDFTSLYETVLAAGPDADVFQVAEVCAVAAIGCQYSQDMPPREIQEALVQTASLHVNSLTDVSSYRAMRILACLIGYGIIETRVSTRAMIQSGLQIARWDLPHHLRDEGWLKIYRSLFFFECWLSTSLGYEPLLPDNDTQELFSRISSPEDVNAQSQRQMYELGLVRAQVLTRVYGSQPPTSQTIEELAKALDDWYQALPGDVNLGSLIAGEATHFTISQQGALFLSHCMHLGAIVLLHRRALVNIADNTLGQQWTSQDITLTQAQTYQARCVNAARTIVRVFLLLRLESDACGIHIRCWLSTFEIFNACTILLYDIAVNMLGNSIDEIEINDELERVDSCLKMLEVSVHSSHIASRIRASLVPAYQHLKSVSSTRSRQNNRPVSESMGSGSASHDQEDWSDSNTEVGQTFFALQEVTKILRDPFGHGEANELRIVPRSFPSPTSNWFDRNET